MPFLNELSGSANPTQTVFTDNIIITEPLDGPTSVDDVMDRFPEEIYQQGRDSHIYRLLTALCGDSGAGLAKKQAYAARLQMEAEFLSFDVLDQIYASQFSFRRLATEIYPNLIGQQEGATITDSALTVSEWDQVNLADQSYFHRVQDFWTATRYGNSTEGMRLAAQAGTGLICDIIEHYKYVLDQYSDDPLGITPNGITTTTQEFVVVPRVRNDSPEIYQAPRQRVWTFTAPVLGATGPRPVPAPTGANKFKVAMTYSTLTKDYLDPAIEHNTVNMIDRLRPVDAIFTFEPEDARYTVLSITAPVYGSTERTHVSRFVTGNTNVNWPPQDKTINAFVVSNSEEEAGYFYGSQMEIPIIFKTIDTAMAYTEKALADPTYNTPDFLVSVGGVTPLSLYSSVHYGVYFQNLQALFPFLATVTSDMIFNANQGIAAQNTPFVLTGSSV